MLESLSRRLVEWSRLRRDIRRLRLLDDVLLADIGIERNRIARIVRTGQR